VAFAFLYPPFGYHDIYAVDRSVQCGSVSQVVLSTRYKILRGLKARRATRQIARFEQRCQQSVVLPVTDAIIVRAADVYALLHQEGQLISDADILIAATALEHSLVMVTENADHFRRIPGLPIESWRT
jgi:tRNA(fMet)-specific endonuclease VapC